MDHTLFYKHSGRFEAGPTVIAFVAAIVCSLVFGAIYGVLVWVVPFIYVIVFGTIGLGLAVGFISGHLGKWAKIRNTPLSIVMPLLAGFAAMYAAWAGWLYAFSDWTLLSFNPVEITRVARAIATQGAWSMFSTTPTGIWLYLIWLIEFGIVVIGAILLCAGAIAGVPFSEKTGQWAEQTYTFPPANALTPEAIAQARQELERGDFSCFALFEPSEDHDTSAHTSFLVNYVEGFEEEMFLTISSIESHYNSEGELMVKTEPIAQHMIIDAEAYQTIEDILGHDESSDAEEEPAADDEDELSL